MSLIKTIKEKIAEGVSLKDVKHICKRQKEGTALNNFFKYCEELMVQKMITDGKSFPEIITATGEKANHFELKWTETRISKLAKVKPAKEKKEIPTVQAQTLPPTPAPEAPVTEPVKRGRKKKEA